ncbi:4Fe-4S binding protein [Methanobacterium sp. SMA-27]|uniref:4Fe-4S binding protein n=1 Tax=Methanobacterium sp. SMA-27 TaxID=1495336 RepID=UPI000694296F|nr:4Fe-4S binding protein [Methanobacterium sp. SMA-27]
MSILSGVISSYSNYRFNKMRKLEISVNNKNNVIKSIKTSPERFTVQKKVPIRSIPTMISIGKNIEDNVKSLKNNPDIPNTRASIEFMDKFEEHARSMGINDIGYTKVDSELIFKDRAVIYENAIVFIKEIDKFGVDNDFPGKQLKDLELYDDFGRKTNEMVDYLRENGFAAQASHPAQGFVTYPTLAQNAGLGWRGKSNLLITPELGPRQKISAIFTSIENLPVNTGHDHSWIGDYCNYCGKCLKSCPGNAIVEPTDGLNRSKFIPEHCIGCNDICTICLRDCPFNKKDYMQVKDKYEKIKNKKSLNYKTFNLSVC